MSRIFYHPSRPGGAPCPRCGAWARPYKTMPDDGGPRIRYYRCVSGHNFKSVGESKEFTPNIVTECLHNETKYG